jgi:hypothetical protein
MPFPYLQGQSGHGALTAVAALPNNTAAAAAPRPLAPRPAAACLQGGAAQGVGGAGHQPCARWQCIHVCLCQPRECRCHLDHALLAAALAEGPPHEGRGWRVLSMHVVSRCPLQDIVSDVLRGEAHNWEVPEVRH